MELAIEIEFPYVRYAGKPEQKAETLKLPFLNQMVPLKVVTDALGLEWKRQMKKVESKKLDDDKNWDTQVVKLAGTSGRSQLCVAIRTLQFFLDGLNPAKAKDPQLVEHFQKHLVPAVFAHLKRLALEVMETEAAATPNVIHVDNPLDGEDKAVRAMSKFLRPEDVAFCRRMNNLRLGAVVTTTNLRGEKKEVLRELVVSDLTSDEAAKLIEHFHVSHRNGTLGPRELFTGGYDKTNASYTVGSHTKRTIIKPAVTDEGAIPHENILLERVATKTEYAPWAAAAA